MANSTASRVLPTLLLLALAGAAYQLFALRAEQRAALDSQQAALDAAQARLDQLAGEVTLMRLEQRVGNQGPRALLEVLKTYAPILVSARTTQPDYAMAQQQMKAVLRAFGALGEDAAGPIRARIDELDPKEHFDELRWLLEAYAHCAPEAGKAFVADVLAGSRKPSPRLRWAAAELLTRTDRPLAQRTLRRVLMTETSRGVDPDRAAAYGATMPDPAAIAATGFFNFVIHYLRTEDPEAEETLLAVLSRMDQDAATLQETIEALGAMRSARAQQRIEDLYRKPPGAQQNPLFLNKCLDALAAIRGPAVRPFLEEELAKAQHELVQKHIDHLLRELGQGATKEAGVGR